MSRFAFGKLVQRIREELECASDFRMTLTEAARSNPAVMSVTPGHGIMI
jgi:hypothetical protein